MIEGQVCCFLLDLTLELPIKEEDHFLILEIALERGLERGLEQISEERIPKGPNSKGQNSKEQIPKGQIPKGQIPKGQIPKGQILKEQILGKLELKHRVNILNKLESKLTLEVPSTRQVVRHIEEQPRLIG